MNLKTLSLLTISIVLTACLLGCPNPSASESKNANLKTLAIDSGTLTPVFNAAVTEYTVTVANSVTSITVTGTAADKNARVSTPITLTSLVPGVTQTATIEVTAQNGKAKKSYTCLITREAVSNPADPATPVILPLPLPAETSLVMTLTGDDVSQFKLEFDDDYNTTSPFVQESPATWVFTEDENWTDENTTLFVSINTFIDANNDDTCDFEELATNGFFTVTRGTENTASLEIRKSAITVNISGGATATSTFSHPKLINNIFYSNGSLTTVTPISGASEILETYILVSATYAHSLRIYAFDDLNDNNRWDSSDDIISTAVTTYAYAHTVNASITLLPAKPVKIFLSTNPDLLIISESHYQFHYSSAGQAFFIIPTGTGTDGSFIKCDECEADPGTTSHDSYDHFWRLLDLVYAGDEEKIDEAWRNIYLQNKQWKQNIRDAVTYLEDIKGFTVDGEELLPVGFW